MSLEPVADCEIAAIVTYLEMHEPPRMTGDSPRRDCPLSLVRIETSTVEDYRSLFREVGSRWLWFSRLTMADDSLRAIITDPAVDLFIVRDEAGADAGMLELDFRESGECELAFVGLVPALAGQGHGRWLLAEALRLAWRPEIRRVHVHTCTLDHPAALAAYRRAGFRPFKRAIERFVDPRLTGALPRDCAPQVPLVGTLTSAGPDS